MLRWQFGWRTTRLPNTGKKRPWAELAIVFPALVTTLPAAAVEVFIVHRSRCGAPGITAVAGGWDAAAGSLSMMSPYGEPMSGSLSPNSILDQSPENSPRIPDGGSINSMLDNPGPVERSQPAGSVQPNDTDANSGDQPAVGSSILNVQLPQDAKVFINEQLTKTEGSTRSFRSTNLEIGKEHRYSVKAVINRDGIETTQTKLVKLTPGKNETIQFNFEKNKPLQTAIATTLRLEVPEDAIVTLCGSPNPEKW